MGECKIFYLKLCALLGLFDDLVIYRTKKILKLAESYDKGNQDLR